MAHNCPECGEQCWCDMEDHYNPLPGDCVHDCEPEDEDRWDYSEEEDNEA